MKGEQVMVKLTPYRAGATTRNAYTKAMCGLGLRRSLPREFAGLGPCREGGFHSHHLGQHAPGAQPGGVQHSGGAGSGPGERPPGSTPARCPCISGLLKVLNRNPGARLRFCLGETSVTASCVCAGMLLLGPNTRPFCPLFALSVGKPID